MKKGKLFENASWLTEYFFEKVCQKEEFRVYLG